MLHNLPTSTRSRAKFKVIKPSLKVSAFIDCLICWFDRKAWPNCLTPLQTWRAILTSKISFNRRPRRTSPSQVSRRILLLALMGSLELKKIMIWLSLTIANYLTRSILPKITTEANPLVSLAGQLTVKTMTRVWLAQVRLIKPIQQCLTTLKCLVLMTRTNLCRTILNFLSGAKAMCSWVKLDGKWMSMGRSQLLKYGDSNAIKMLLLRERTMSQTTISTPLKRPSTKMELI